MSGAIANLVVDALRRSGIDQLYCIPGVQNDDFFNVLFDAHDIAPIVCRHEQGAAYMALGAAQVTGRPAACCVVPGPGMLNASAALNSAYWAYARVLAIVGQVRSDLIGRETGTLHDLPDQNAILSQLTKHAASVRDAADAVPIIQTALDQLHSGVPRPVSIEVPVDLWGRPADGALTDPVVTTPTVDADAIDRAAALLAGAKHPLLFVGSGAWGAADSVRQLAELTQATVTTRRQGHGVLRRDHPLFVPVTVAHRLWPEVDVVVGIGSRIEWPLDHWGVDDDLDVIQINLDADELDRHGLTTVAVHADAGEACRALIDALGPLARADRTGELDAHRAWFDEATAHLTPQREFTSAIRNVMPDDGVLVEDVTQIGFACHLWYDHRQPRTFLTTGAAGNLGAATAQAIGAASATDRPVVGIVGDGGFLFTATELATAVQHDIPSNIVLFNNGAFGNVRRIQRERFGDDRTIASTLDNPDFSTMMDAFGVRYWRAESPGALEPALAACIAHEGPGLVEVPVEPMPNPWPFLRLPQVRG